MSNVSIEILQRCERRHFDMMREYRLTGDVKYLQGFVAEVIRSLSEEKEGDLIAKFHSAITPREALAFRAIYEEVNEEGNFSVVKMVQKANLSRPVFDNLLAKMREYKIADVANQGVKGTHIKFLISPSLIAEGL